MARQFYLYKRDGVYYAKLRNPEAGAPISARSTGTIDKEDAYFVFTGWLKDGLPSDSKGGRWCGLSLPSMQVWKRLVMILAWMGLERQRPSRPFIGVAWWMLLLHVQFFLYFGVP